MKDKMILFILRVLFFLLLLYDLITPGNKNSATSITSTLKILTGGTTCSLTIHSSYPRPAAKKMAMCQGHVLNLIAMVP